MKAMILAAGEGRRLRPLTDSVPKALVELNGTPLLEIIIRRLIAAGADEFIINVCHLADKIADFLEAKNNFGVRIELSREDALLDTGGGLKKASWFFDDGKPFFLHNGDIISDFDLRAFYGAHLASGALATLFVKTRPADRVFLIDGGGRLAGWECISRGEVIWTNGLVPGALRRPFGCVHVISPEIFGKMTESGVFSINETYLRLAGAGDNIMAWRDDSCRWADIGTPEKLAHARELFKTGNP